MHTTVDFDQVIAPLSNETRQEPVHESMTPVRCAGEGNILCTSTSANLAEHSADKLFGVRDEQRRLADLRHGGGDEMGLDALDADAVGFELGAESGGPLLEEGLGTRVCCKKRSRESTAERSHGEDKTAFTLNHTRCNQLSDPQRSHTVNRNDIRHLLVIGLHEWHRDRMAQSDVIDQDADIETLHQFLEFGVVGVEVLGEVHCVRIDGELGAIFGFDFGSEGFEFVVGAGDEDEVVALCCEGEGEFFADAVRGAGYEGPGALGAELGELERC